MGFEEPGHLLYIPGRNNDADRISGDHKKEASSNLHMQAEHDE